MHRKDDSRAARNSLTVKSAIRDTLLSYGRFPVSLMTVDHGLGGKEGKKGREKRAKRLEKKIRKVKAVETKNKKKEVIFDEKSRVEFLTGFRKRKQERRQYGLAMQYLKDKKASKALKIKAPPVEIFDEPDPVNKVIETASFNDPQTADMFGGVVSVEIQTNVLDQINEALEPRRKSFQQPSNFERAMRKAKHIMHVRDSSRKRTKFSKGLPQANNIRQSGTTGGKRR